MAKRTAEEQQAAQAAQQGVGAAEALRVAQAAQAAGQQCAAQPTMRDALERAAAAAAARNPMDAPARSPLDIQVLTNPVGVAREYALAVAEICKAAQLMPQSRVRAMRLLRMAVELLGE